MGCGPTKDTPSSTVHKKEPVAASPRAASPKKLNQDETSLKETPTININEVQQASPEPAKEVPIVEEKKVVVPQEKLEEKVQAPVQASTEVPVQSNKKDEEMSEPPVSALVNKKLQVIEVDYPSALVNNEKEPPKKNVKDTKDVVKEIPIEKKAPKEDKKVEVPVFNKALFKTSTKHSELKTIVDANIAKYRPTIDLSLLNSRGKEYYEYALSLHKIFEDLIDDTRWKQSDKGKDWKGFSMSYEGYVSSKSVGNLPGTPIEIHSYITNPKFISDYNDLIKETTIIEEYPTNMKLMRMRGKGSFVVDAREFLVINHVTFNGTNGTIEAVSGSVEDDRCPLEKKFVRAYMRIMGTRLIPTATGETEIITISMADPKGNIPNMFKNSAGKQQSTRANLIAKGFKKRFP